MSNHIRTLFYLNKSRLNNKQEAPLMLRITYNGAVKQISTGFYIRPDKWDPKSKKVTGDKKTSAILNEYMLQTRANILNFINSRKITDEITLDKIVDLMTGKTANQITLLEAIEQHNKEFLCRVGIDYAESTYEKYDVTRKKIEKYLGKLGKQSITLRDLKLPFIADFEYFLKVDEGNQHNTAVKYCKNLKKIVNNCVLKGLIDVNPFQGYNCGYRDIDKTYLLEHELKTLESKTFGIKRLEIVKDLFVFQCYTGLSFVDMAKLSKEDITTGVDGNKWIIQNRKKTEIKAYIPLLPGALKILEKYEHNSDARLLPLYSIQKFNSYLAEIAVLCNINKRISSHVGRRTFGNLALSKGVSLNVIAKMLGHSNTIITQKIYAITDQKIISQEIGKMKDSPPAGISK